MARKRGIIEVPTAMYHSEREKLNAAGWIVIHNPLVKASHVVVREPDEQSVTGKRAPLRRRRHTQKASEK